MNKTAYTNVKNVANFRSFANPLVLVIRILDFEFVLDFGFSASNLTSWVRAKS